MSTEEWPAIVARAEREGLRPIATDYGVSQETIRAILRRTGHAEMLADSDRRRILEATAPLPPPAPLKVARERYGEVALLCQRHTQAEVAVMFGVSQATIWRITRQAAARENIEATERTGCAGRLVHPR